VGPKPTSTIPSYSRQVKTDFLYFKQFQWGQNQLPPFQSGQNQLPPFQTIPVRQKPLAKTDYLHSKPLQSGQTRLPPFQGNQVRLKQTSSIPSHFDQPNIVNKSFLPSLPCRSWSPNYSVLVMLWKSIMDQFLLAPFVSESTLGCKSEKRTQKAKVKTTLIPQCLFNAYFLLFDLNLPLIYLFIYFRW
jgi:hypothetical protein